MLCVVVGGCCVCGCVSLAAGGAGGPVSPVSIVCFFRVYLGLGENIEKKVVSREDR